MKKDFVLITWLIVDLLWAIFLISGTAYLVFWKGFSGFWFLLAMWLGNSPTLYKILRKRYFIKEED